MGSPIDLKNCSIFVRDGYSNAGAVNHSGGYALGDTTMVVDGITGIIPLWSRFTVAGETGSPVHTVTAHSETTGNTTSLTFTPALAGSVADNAVITFTYNEIELVVGEGNLTFTEKKAREYKLNKGRLYSVRNGDEAPVELNFSFYWEFLKSSVTEGEQPTLEEALKQEGQCSGWVTTDTVNPCAPYAVDIVIRNNPPCTNIDNEEVQFKYFRYEELSHNAKDATVECKGSCNLTSPIKVRGAS